MRLGNKDENVTYTMKGTDDKGEEKVYTLKESKEEKDLGVIVDNELDFKKHVATVTSKANRTLGIIRRSFTHLANDTFVLLYKAVVRPTLEYGHAIYNPHLKTLCCELEDVQRRATRLLGNLKELPYNERLKKIKLEN